jgi:DNA-binding response OmpR family regulator
MPKIMIVDDDKSFTTLYRAYLTMAGFETVIENHSSRAAQLAASVKPDLFILDLTMPEPDGFKLCRILRADNNFKYTPIIIVTALNDTDSRVVALGSGADDYLVKPFHIDDLKLRIDSLLEKK